MANRRVGSTNTGAGVGMTLGEKVDSIAGRFPEVSFRWDASWGFWVLDFGDRPGKMYWALESDTFDEAVDEFLRQLDAVAAPAVGG